MVALANRRRLLEGELDASSSCSKGLLGGVIEVVEPQAAGHSGWGQGLCRAEHLVACRTARNGVVLAFGHVYTTGLGKEQSSLSEICGMGQGKDVHDKCKCSAGADTRGGLWGR